ncbi:MAG TPA: DNA polymerase III subunit gamma and tau, partial [Propionicimonas sp.]
DEAHMVTPQGFNALLKVVEEPPPHVRFVFATTEPDKVLGTIRSRTHHYPFRLVPPKTLSSYLATLCDAEGIAVEPAVLPLVVRAGAGSVRDSLSVLDQLLGGAGPDGVSYAQATSLLGYTPDTLLDEIVDAFAAGDARGVFAAVDKVIEVGQDPRRFAEDLLRRLRDLIIVAAVPEALSSGLVDVAGDQADRLTMQASALGPGELTRAAEVIAVGLTEMRGTTAPRLHLELMCARVLLPGADVNDRGLHARLDRIERRMSMGDAPSPVAEAPVRKLPAPQKVAEAPVQSPPAHTVPEEPVRNEPPSGRRRPEPVERAAEPAAAAPISDEPAAEPTTRSVPEEVREPASEPSRRAAEPVAQAVPEPVPAPPEPAPVEPAEAQPGTFGTADVRRFWPQILDNVKNRRRFTWILLSQNAQVVEVREGVLTLGLANVGARDSFGRGGSPDVLREAILEVLGAALHINPIVDATAEAPTPSGSPDPVAPPTSPVSPPRSQAAQAARSNLRATRSQATPPEPTEEPSRDDAVVDEAGQSTDELLMKHLGAELIAEEDA